VVKNTLLPNLKMKNFQIIGENGPISEPWKFDAPAEGGDKPIEEPLVFEGDSEDISSSLKKEKIINLKTKPFISKDRSVLSKAERKVYEQVLYGDLPKSQRKTRNASELIFTKEKKHVNIKDSDTLVSSLSKPEEADNEFIMFGTNGKASYAIVATNEDAKRDTKVYLNHIQKLGNEALYTNFFHRITFAQSSKQVANMLVELTAIIGRNESFRPWFDRLHPFLNEQMKKLPTKVVVKTGAEEDDNYDPEEIVISKRPECGNVIFTSHKWYSSGDHPGEHPTKEEKNDNVKSGEKGPSAPGTPDTTGSKAQETPPGKAGPAARFQLWYCNDKKWVQAQTKPILVLPGTVPSIAFNELHLVILYQAVEDENNLDLFTVDVVKLNSSNGRPSRGVIASFKFTFPDLYYSSYKSGILGISLSQLDLCVVYFSVGVIVFDILKKIEQPRLVYIENKQISYAKITHTIGNDDRYSKDWTGKLGLSTTTGEHISVAWYENQKCIESEMIPACEPIWQSMNSNMRLVLCSMNAITARLNPFYSRSLTQIPTGSILCTHISGSLLFILLHDGTVQIYSTHDQAKLFPFKAPTSGGGGGPIRYDAIYNDNEKIIVAYPNGLVRTFSIKPDILKKIDQSVFFSKK
jgi:hypothetical protein